MTDHSKKSGNQPLKAIDQPVEPSDQPMDKSEKPRVLIVHNYYQIPGGEDTVVANEKKLLEDNGHEVFLYSRHNNELKKFSLFQKLLLPFTTVFSLKTYQDIKHQIKDKKIDIVHVHNTLSLISPSVYYAAFSCKVPVVQTIHNFRLLCPGATFYRDGHICEDCVSQGLKCALKHKCYRGSFSQTLACVITLKIHRLLGTYKKLNYICLTEFNRQKLLQLNSKDRKIIDDGRVFVKPNFTSDEGGHSDPQDYYLFIGRLEEIKGIDLLIDAFKGLPDHNLLVVGIGDLDAKIQIRLKIQGIQNIELLGYRQRKELNSFLRHAKALIVCSQCYETFGLTIIEAYSNGTPAIVGDIGNIKDLVKDGVTGIRFQYDSPEGLHRAVLRFETMDGKQLGYKAYQYYLANFNNESNYQKQDQIYSEIVN